MMHIFNMLGASFSLVFLLMIGLWVVYLFQRNAGIVDIGWSVGFLITAWSYFFLGNGDFLKMSVMTLMATIWAARLTSYLFSRFRSDNEDARYTYMREQWGGGSKNLLFLMIFIFQGVLVVALSMPFFLVSYGSHSEWSWWEFWGIVIWFLGVAGESFADSQLALFNKDPNNKEKVCKNGLWRFSRHPNYFFESVVWIGFFLFAVPSDWGWLSIISPSIILLLLLKGSGIPATEAQSLRSKGDLYRDYQRTTSAFIPWFPND